jgi:1-acyl-sn-glycerol-3-phosphate acyltransferase
MKIMLRVTFKFEGIEIFEQVRRESGPFLIACKHQSGVETVIFSLFLNNFNILAKEEMKKVPLIGSYMKHLGFIFIDRSSGRKAIEMLFEKGARSISEGKSLLIFPEGSRSAFGERGKYHVGVAMLYDKLRVPIVPVALNAGAVWAKKSIIKLPGVITIRVLPPIEVGLSVRDALLQLEKKIENACEELGNGCSLK